MKVKAFDIDWDTDGEEVDLPNDTIIDVDVEDDDDVSERVCDALSDKFGFCINHCQFEVLHD